MTGLLILWTFVFACLSLALEVKPCNPIKDDNCEGVNPALSSSIVEYFSEESPYFDIFSERGQTNYSEDGLKLTINKRYDNPSLKSNFYILFGKIEVIAKSAAGQGIISSVFLQSDDLDEIDLEWIGGDPSSVQTNYFAKGDTSDYARGAHHQVEDCHDEFHNYTVEWTKEKLDFYVDEELVRTVYGNSRENTYGYPQTPMTVYIGIWVGGDPDNAVGTIQWAGGLTDFSKGPFSMEIEKIIVSDYSSGKNYRYTDSSGDWTSITSVDGSVNGRIAQANSEFSILSAGGILGIPGQNRKDVAKVDRDRRSFIQFGNSTNREAEPKKATNREAEPEQTANRKAEPEQTANRKAEPEQTANRKAEPKQTANRKAEPKNAANRKAEPKNAANRKAEPKQTANRKAEPKNAANRKAEPNNAAIQGAEPKKATSQGAVIRKTGVGTLMMVVSLLLIVF